MTYSHEAMQSQADKLKELVLHLLQRHVGADRAVKAPDIAATLGQSTDRAVREAIRQLRRDGHLILSSISPPYGYFLAASREEWCEFRDRNLRPRAMDILETAKAMAEAAQRRYGSTAALDLEKVEQLGLGL